MIERRVTRQSYVAGMRVILLVTALALGASAATAASTGTVTRGSVQVDGQTRTYHLRSRATEEAGAARVRLPRRLRHGSAWRARPDSTPRRRARLRRRLPGRARARLERRAVLRSFEQARRRRRRLRRCCSTDSDGSTRSTGSGSTPPASRTAASSRTGSRVSSPVGSRPPHLSRPRSSRSARPHVPSRSSTCTGWKTRTSRSGGQGARGVVNSNGRRPRTASSAGARWTAVPRR